MPRNGLRGNSLGFSFAHFVVITLSPYTSTHKIEKPDKDSLGIFIRPGYSVFSRSFLCTPILKTMPVTSPALFTLNVNSASTSLAKNSVFDAA